MPKRIKLLYQTDKKLDLICLSPFLHITKGRRMVSLRLKVTNKGENKGETQGQVRASILFHFMNALFQISYRRLLWICK